MQRHTLSLRRRRVEAAVCAMLVALAACVTGLDERAPEIRSLDQARARWTAAHITNYDYVLTVLCFCGEPAGQPLRIRVRGGVLVDARRVSDDVPVPVPTDPGHVQIPTIPQLFDKLADAYGRATGPVEAAYDATDGHPTEISIDYIAAAIDDELGYTVTGLVAVP